jgi:hypothetical protein
MLVTNLQLLPKVTKCVQIGCLVLTPQKKPPQQLGKWFIASAKAAFRDSKAALWLPLVSAESVSVAQSSVAAQSARGLTHNM